MLVGLSKSGSISANIWTHRTLPGGANLFSAELLLLESINALVEVQDNVGAVGDEQSILGLDAVSLELLELLEEAWNVNNGSGTDEVDAGLVDETQAGWDHVVVKGLSLGDNGLEVS